MTNSLSTIPINRLNSNELNEKINTSVEEKANIDLSNTSFANLENVDGTLTWDGNALLNSSSLKTINNNSLVGSGNISIASSPISALCTTEATTSSTASSTKPAVIIQNYRNGNDWYRVWSDGWIEQGGFVSQGSSTQVTLLKPLNNSNYFVSTTPNSTTEGSYEMVISAKTTTSFTIASRGGAANLSKLWMVIGQGA